MSPATWRWICYVSAAGLSLLTVAIGLVHFLFRLNVRPQLEAIRGTQDRYYQAYLDDVLFLSRWDVFPAKATATRNAGTALNHRVYWSPVPSEGYPTQPAISPELRETLLRFRGDWMKKFERVKHMKVDLSLFYSVHGYDHWDLEVDSPIADLAKKGVFVPPPKLPVPEASDLLALVKLRLMSGALKGDHLPALQDVHDLATLMLTTENTQLVLAGLAALDYERFAFRFYVEEQGMRSESWQPTDRNLTRRGHRAVLATRAYLHLWTDENKLERIFLREASPIGFCASVNEAMPTEFALRSRLEPRWPLEISLKDEYARIDRIFERARAECRLRYLSELEDKGLIHARVPGPLILTEIPYSRKVFGLRSAVVGFQGLDAYEASPL